MTDGIEIGIASETKAFKLGIDNGVIEPLDDAADKLTELGKNRGLDKLEDSLEDAQKETEALKKETKVTADAIEKEYKKSYRSVDTNSKKGFATAREASDGFKDEAKQNFAETAASFDGSMESIADLGQSTFAGLATSIAGPVGLAAAGLGALGGLLLSQWTTATEGIKEKVSDMYADMLDSGENYLSQSYINDSLAGLQEDQDEYNRLVKLAKDYNLELSDVLIAQVTKGDERTRVQAALADEYERQLGLSGEVEDGMTYTANAAAGVANELGKWNEHFDELDTNQADALSTVGQVREAQEKVNAKFTEEGELIAKNNAKLKEKPISIPVKYDVDTSALDRARRDYATLPIKIAYNDGRTGQRIY